MTAPWVGAALAVVMLNGALLRSRPSPPGPAPEFHAVQETALETAGLFALGMRRLAADLGLIRVIIYYGTPEDDGHGHGHGHHGHDEFDPEHPERHYGGGRYPEMLAKAKSLVDVDPAFVYPVLFASGALAFNLNRPDEALELLSYALARDPRNLQYQSYVGAIGFHRKGDSAAVISLLEPALASPDCPTMIKSIMAFLYKRSGRRDKAIALYRDIHRNSRDEGYRRISARMLAEYGVAP